MVSKCIKNVAEISEKGHDRLQLCSLYSNTQEVMLNINQHIDPYSDTNNCTLGTPLRFITACILHVIWNVGWRKWIQQCGYGMQYIRVWFRKNKERA